MKTNNMQAWVVPGILSALLLTACGGGGGGSGDDGTTTPSLFAITSVNTETAAVKITNTTAAAVEDVQVLVSTVKTLSGTEATSEDATSVPVRDMVLYNSGEGVTSLPDIASNANSTFSLKNVNFAAASSNTASSATETAEVTCTGDTDTVLGTVRIEVFSQGSQLLERDVPVCAMQGKTYSVSL